MADNVAITAGAGTSIATDDVAGVHYQRVKLVDGTLEGTGAIGGDATNGLDVDVTRVIPGTSATHLGKAEDAAHTSGDTGVMALGVANEANAALAGTDGDYTPLATDLKGNANVLCRVGTKRIAVTSGGLTTATTAYSAGDTLGSLFSFAGAARASGGTGRVVGAVILDETDVMGPTDIYLFRASVTFGTDNAAPSISDADAAECVGVISLTNVSDLANNRILTAPNISIPYDCSGGTTLYGGLVTRSGHSFFGATTSIKVTLFVELD